MKKITVAGLGILLVGALLAGYRACQPRSSDDRSPQALPQAPAPVAPNPPEAASAVTSEPAAAAGPTSQTSQSGMLFGRVTTLEGATYVGRLRFGGNQEAFWGDYFLGSKKGNSWAAGLPAEKLPKERSRVTLFGIDFGYRERALSLRRFLMVRFGDIVRIEPGVSEVRVTTKSGTVVTLDRFEASDFDDGLRVWDETRGLADLDSTRISKIEFLPTGQIATSEARLHGTVHTKTGTFSGFLQWNREANLASDELHEDDGPGSVLLGSVRTIARRPGDRTLLTLVDGRELEFGLDHEYQRGVSVDDPRYGRVLVSWDVFERVDFGPPGALGSGPAYGEFAPGRPLSGTLTTQNGRQVSGRLVFDLDESETTETLDAPAQGVDYTLPFGQVASLEPTGRVRLRNGEELQLERRGDLGPTNAGLLVFVADAPSPEYVPWGDVARVEFDPPDR